MNDVERVRYLRVALRVVGVFAIVGFYPLTRVWPSGWAWHSGQSEYLQMIVAIYATLGVFLIIAARDPDHHVGLVSFGIWSSIVHGSVMAVLAVVDREHVGHLYGDVPALFLVAAVLGFLAPRALRLPWARSSAAGSPPPAR